jgi:hypothetical protein
MASLYTLSDIDRHQPYFDLSVVHGKVIKDTMWAESHTSGGGTSAISGRNKSVHTSVSRKREFVIRTPEGIEKHYSASADDLKISEGQFVTVLVATKKNSEKVVTVINYTQDKLTRVTSNGDLGRMSSYRALLFSPILFIFPGSCIGTVTMPEPEMAILVLLLAFPALITVTIIVQLVGKGIHKDIDKIAKSIMAQTTLADVKAAMANAPE